MEEQSGHTFLSLISWESNESETGVYFAGALWTSLGDSYQSVPYFENHMAQAASLHYPPKVMFPQLRTTAEGYNE